MLGDYWYYIKFRVAEWFKEKKRKRTALQRKGAVRKQNYMFQKVAICIAAVLWLITAGNVLWGGKSTTGQQKIISAFSSTAYIDTTASVSAYGKYGNIGLTENAKKIILEKIAEKIGIDRYQIDDTTEDGNAVKTLSQSSANGDVICKFITVSESSGSDTLSSSQYLYVGVTLKNAIDSAFTYEKVIKDIMTDMETDACVTVNLKGEIKGKLTTDAKDTITDQMLSKIDAKIKAQNKDEDLYTVYAYDDAIKKYITVGSDKVNVNVSISYDEQNDITNVYFSTPINNQDY